MKLLIFDVGGVFRDSSLVVQEGFKRGFKKVNLKYNFGSEEVWHLRGIGKYNSSREAIKGLIAVQRAQEDLNRIIERANCEEVLDKLVNKFITDDDLKSVEKIRKKYKIFFNSSKAKKHIKIFPFCKKAINKLSNKSELAIFTNTGKETIKRDLNFADKFSLILGEEEVKHKKPSGEGIVRVMSKLGYKENETGYIGDSVVDILAAKNAGVCSIGVCSGMGLKKHLELVKPDYLFENILDLSYKL